MGDITQLIEAATEVEDAVEGVLLASARYRAMAAEAERRARGYGIQGKRATDYNGKRFLEGYLRWQLGGLMELARQDRAVRTRLSVATAGLMQTLEGGA